MQILLNSSLLSPSYHVDQWVVWEVSILWVGREWFYQWQKVSVSILFAKVLLGMSFLPVSVWFGVKCFTRRAWTRRRFPHWCHVVSLATGGITQPPAGVTRSYPYGHVAVEKLKCFNMSLECLGSFTGWKIQMLRTRNSSYDP